MEIPALLLCPILFFLGSGSKGLIPTLAIICWLTHYVQRTLVYPFRIKTKGKEIPLIIVLMAILFNGVNGTLIGIYLGNYAIFSGTIFQHPVTILGLILFVLGMGLNLTTDNQLIRLRKPNETGYKIPKGGLFNQVSCPNLLGEIIEWGGFALITSAAPMFAFFIWTAANLIPRALAHHKWYKEHFTEYPVERKAIIPYLL